MWSLQEVTVVLSIWGWRKDGRWEKLVPGFSFRPTVVGPGAMTLHTQLWLKAAETPPAVLGGPGSQGGCGR